MPPFLSVLPKVKSALRTCQELSGVILRLFCCVGWFCARARLGTATPGRNKTNKESCAATRYSWQLLSVDWPYHERIFNCCYVFQELVAMKVAFWCKFVGLETKALLDLLWSFWWKIVSCFCLRIFDYIVCYIAVLSVVPVIIVLYLVKKHLCVHPFSVC